MKMKFSPLFKDEGEVVAAWGEAQLIKYLDSKTELRGGSDQGRARTLLSISPTSKFRSTLRHEIQRDSVPPRRRYPFLSAGAPLCFFDPAAYPRPYGHNGAINGKTRSLTQAPSLPKSTQCGRPKKQYSLTARA